MLRFWEGGDLLCLIVSVAEKSARHYLLHRAKTLGKFIRIDSCGAGVSSSADSVVQSTDKKTMLLLIPTERTLRMPFETDFTTRDNTEAGLKLRACILDA